MTSLLVHAGYVCIIAATDAALLIDVEGTEVWLPRSQIDEESGLSDVGDQGDLIIPEWLAENHGLPYEPYE